MFEKIMDYGAKHVQIMLGCASLRKSLDLVKNVQFLVKFMLKRLKTELTMYK